MPQAGDRALTARCEANPHTDSTGETADQDTAAWDGRGITNTPTGPVTTEEW
ncbi:hypothetical protein GCM10010497_40820 [Streptomyces cinereoruber]|uniref:Peptidase n=1 Tax=Streptomyces cinereoruber TaxID=67260 RepID=A0AAV4KP76_9ACTN|nr:hypothetical protein [Streptomyces cinereoruber]NIH60327.1 hypothetical protein [Streptomyces cinereoruber]GGR33828.1 hypothetical protein GCM10010497_40820 [Streptomyces cinereoruber]